MLLRRSPALLALLVALPVVGCDDGDSPTLPDVARSLIEVTVIPTPVLAEQAAVSGTVTASYRVNLQERNGLGCEVLFVSSSVFDPETGLQAALNYFDSSDLLVFVGSKRVEPLQSLVVPQTVSYLLPDLRKEANLAVLVQVKDDRGNVANQSVLVKIQ